MAREALQVSSAVKNAIFCHAIHDLLIFGFYVINYRGVLTKKLILN